MDEFVQKGKKIKYSVTCLVTPDTAGLQCFSHLTNIRRTFHSYRGHSIDIRPIWVKIKFHFTCAGQKLLQIVEKQPNITTIITRGNLPVIDETYKQTNFLLPLNFDKNVELQTINLCSLQKISKMKSRKTFVTSFNFRNSCP